MSVSLRLGVNGLPKLVLSHPSGSSAEVYLHGAHLTSWVPTGGGEALFLSRAAEFAPGRAIRGGIPVVFPQFADLGPLPKHGFSRIQTWRWTGPDEQGGPAVGAALQLSDTEQTRAVWPHAFLAELTVELGESDLVVGLSVHNRDADPISFTTALHTYFRVADVRRAAVEGLRGVRYRDRGRGAKEQVEREAERTVAGEIDRVYADPPSELRLHDRAGERTFRLRSEGFADAVVWNPWVSGAAALADLEPEDYLRMICIEPAQVREPILLPPGASWRGVQRVEVGAAAAGAEGSDARE